jgi:peptide deformylase
VSREIVTLGDPRLRMRGDRVRVFDKQLHRLLEDMLAAMRAVNGVGLAAQQVGVPLQVCVIEVEGDVHELINPRITHLSGEQDDLEGCLSIPGYYAYRKRADHAVVEAQNRHGRKIRLSGNDLLARAIQHEFDHLQGELYIDKLGPEADLISVETIREMQRQADEDGTELSAEEARLAMRADARSGSASGSAARRDSEVPAPVE